MLVSGLTFVHGTVFHYIGLLIFEQVLLRSDEAATTRQKLAHNDGLVEYMRTLAEQDELVPFLDMSMTVKFHAEKQDPNIGQINENGPGMSMSLLTITIS